jgi:hypothetical protein
MEELLNGGKWNVEKAFGETTVRKIFSAMREASQNKKSRGGT